MLEADGNAAGQTVLEFRKEIVENIQQELSQAEISIFVNALREELNKLRSKHQFSEDDLQTGEITRIADALVWVMENGGEDVPSIQKALKGAYMHCFDRKGNYFSTAQPFKVQITEAVEQLLGWLVLAAVDQKELSKLLPRADFSKGVYFEIPVETHGGVELIVSHCSEHSADIVTGGSEVTAAYQTSVDTQYFNWKESSALDNLKLLVWKRIFPEEAQELPLTGTQVRKLDAEISALRNEDWGDREHHYLAFKGAEITTNEHYQSVCDKLLIELPSLTLVNFGALGQESVFYMPEHHLMQRINRFLTAINKV